MYNTGWGNMQLSTVTVHPAHVMSAYFVAAEYEHPAVTFEIVISLNMLAKKQGPSLDAPTWDAVTKVLGSAMKVSTHCLTNTHTHTHTHTHTYTHTHTHTHTHTNARMTVMPCGTKDTIVD